MATTIHEPPKVERSAGKLRAEGVSGDGGWRNLSPADGDIRAVQDYSSPPASTGIWVGITGISMMFAAFTSALVVRQGSAPDWRHFILPPVLYANTALLFASSFSLEMARRRIAAFMGGTRNRAERPALWLHITLGLGLLFVLGQYTAWRQLSARGLFVATNPSSSFFYVLTATHALHVLGGLLGLVYVIRKLNAMVLRRTTLDTAARYWHFMDVLWLYLLILLWVKL
ncbi:MAG TPA: cytochrome c oxidase subunit 3 [Terriglobales bacterium]|nr:cytochrome c oxidase subunit 3 [Terriglobales bacterium]